MFYRTIDKRVSRRRRSDMKTRIAVLHKRGENAVPMVTAVLEQLQPEKEMCFGVATPTNFITEEKPSKLKAHKLDSPVAVGYAASTALPRDEPQIARLEDATIVFDGITYEPAEKNSALEVIAQKLQDDSCAFAEAFVRDVKGDFSLAIAEPEQIVAARDPVGVQPLYYGENEALAALASNRRALWKLGLTEPKSFPPGHVVSVTRAGFRFKPVKTLPYQTPVSISLAEAADKLQHLLESSVQKRVFGVKKVAVAFSGGLDSSVIAFLAKKCGVEVELLHVSLENQPETEEAWEAAEELQLPMQVHLFKESDVEKVIAEVVWLIEEADPVKASVGVPFFWTAQKTAEAGLKVLLAGQGADELFGGYQRYVTEYLAEGDEKVRQTMYHDVVNIHESNIERDEKICIFHDVELRLPFASFELAEFALSLPTELKFEKKQDSLRKLALRKAAENLGLSKAIAEKPKKAVQYSTGISGALKKLAKKQNLSMSEYLNGIYVKVKKSDL
jgi:asparagine synthase (glutamine-hydrolysing)